MGELASEGDFCPTPVCEEYGKIQAGNIIRYGKSKTGCQRMQGKACGQTFNERKGTMFYNRKTDEKEIVDCPA
jgi:transposase-like protein